MGLADGRYKPDWKSFSQELQSSVCPSCLLFCSKFAQQLARYETVTDIAKWSNESFQYVRNDVYKFDPNGLNGALRYLNFYNVFYNDPCL